MKKLLNTLYVSTQGSYLHRDGECVVVEVERQEKLRAPIHMLSSIVGFGNVACSPHLLGFCAESGVTISFLSENGRYWASVTGPVSGNVLLRRAQYRASENPAFCVPIVRALVAGKVANSRTVLQRALRDHGGKSDMSRVENAVAWLSNRLRVLEITNTVDELRGIEGEAARTYFGCFNDLIVAQREDFTFRERSRRPPLDPVNALLSFLYTLLVHDVRGACESVGLDPQVGFLHRDRPGRPSLALDLMEELRAPVADRLALSLINLRQVAGKGFRKDAAGGITMDDDTRKSVLIAYQKRKQETLEHPFSEETAPVGLVPFLQAQLLARHLRGDLDGYPPFFWK